MRLYDYLPKNGDETAVVDNVYDIESYFYYTDDKSDLWDLTLTRLSKLLTATPLSNGKLSVNLSDVIENHLDALKSANLFKRCDIDSIMGDIEAILAGYVPDDWLIKFVNILEK